MLWAALHVPDLALRIFRRGEAGERPAVVSSRSHRPDVILANDSAHALGIAPGLSIAAALALEPGLAVHLRDEPAEAQALCSIAVWAGQFTSTISLEPPASLLLEISGCILYFRGLDRLLDLIESGLGDLGFRARIALAPNPSAASLLARSGRPCRHGGSLQEALDAVPVALLSTASASLPTLEGLGIKRFADLRALPRDGIARRFGQPLLDEIDRLQARLPDVRAQFVPPEHYRGQLELPAPVAETEALLFAIKRLLAELAGFLQGRGAGITRLRCDLVHDEAPPTSIVFGLAATRSSEHMLTVLRERFARVQLPDRVEAIRLVSEEIVAFNPQEGDFFPCPGRHAQASAELIERLRARLGDPAVHGIAQHADHRPELAWKRAEPSLAVAPKPATPAKPSAPPKPAAAAKPIAAAKPAAPAEPAAPPRPAAAAEPAAPAKPAAAATARPVGPAVAAGGRCNAVPAPDPRSRPLWLLSEPRPLAGTSMQAYRLVAGPERIESGWWDGGDASRDYFVGVNDAGERCWLFRDRAGAWFMHGVFA